MNTVESFLGWMEDELGFNDHNMQRSRPYTGQPHTDTGLRGKTEIRGITFRDLRDAYIRAVLLSTGADEFPDPEHRARMRVLYDEACKGENAVLCENDLFGWNLNHLDPVAIMQNLSCEIERLMGIYPNLPEQS